MDFQLSPDQAEVISAVEQILERHRDLPAEHRAARCYYDHALDKQLVEGGFLDLAVTEGYGPLEAALLIDAVARLPAVVELGASGLIAPALGLAGTRPLALISGGLDKPHRYLPLAQAALIDTGDDVLLLEIHPDNVTPVESLYAYPYGRFRHLPNRSTAQRLGAEAVPVLRQWWRVSLAVECAAAMEAAVAFTVQYVKDRRQFGKPLGAFQAIQHRLAECEQLARGARWLALHAAWSGDPADAAMAATYAQQPIQKVVFDLHQFNGAMGMTTEHQLHFWTYRIRALQSELGGAARNALAVADMVWPQQA